MGATDGRRQAIETDAAPTPIGPYSQAVEAGGVLYCSGQVPLDPRTGEVVEGGISEGFFSEPFPVRTTVGVAALPKGALVEMDATVALARSPRTGDGGSAGGTRR